MNYALDGPYACDTLKDMSDHGKRGLHLEEIVSALEERKQRATYGAVAGVLGGTPHTIMGSRQRSPRYSWVVAVNGAPTGYAENQIDPDCLRQIQSGNENIISDPATLMEWLGLR